MDVKSFIEEAFRDKTKSLGFQISDERLMKILSSFDLDAVQKYIDDEVNKKLAGSRDSSERIAIRFKSEMDHRSKLKNITEQWVVYYFRQSRTKAILLEEDFRMITASMKQEAQFCDSYPCQKK